MTVIFIWWTCCIAMEIYGAVVKAEGWNNSWWISLWWEKIEARIFNSWVVWWNPFNLVLSEYVTCICGWVMKNTEPLMSLRYHCTEQGLGEETSLFLHYRWLVIFVPVLHHHHCHTHAIMLPRFLFLTVPWLLFMLAILCPVHLVPERTSKKAVFIATHIYMNILFWHIWMNGLSDYTLWLNK